MRNRPPVVIASPADLAAPGYYRLLYPLQISNLLGSIQLIMPDKMRFIPIEILSEIKPDSTFIQRVHTTDHLKYLQAIKDKTNIMTVYDIDDWMEKTPKYSPHFKFVSDTIATELKKAISKCDRLCVTNDLLANVYGNKKDTYIIPNYLSSSVWSEVYQAGRILVNDTKPRIGWAGGIGHTGDLNLLIDVARELGDSVRWVFLGMIPKGIDITNVSAPEAADIRQYPHALYGLDLDLAIAPLLNNDFNKAKSNLKILEYGACGYPVLASDVKPYHDAVHKQNAPITLLPYDTNAWVKAIKDKISHLDKCKEEGRKLQEWVWSNYRLEDHVDQYSALLSPDNIPFKSEILASEKVDDTVDIIITTHNNPEVVKACVTSVMESIPFNQTKVEIIISDNASDDLEMKEYLSSLHDLNAENLNVIIRDKDYGYVENVNLAMELHANRDVITLNSDTVVHDNWIDRLKNGIYKNAKSASNTALSNNAITLSYPNPKGSDLSVPLVKFYDDIAKYLGFQSVVNLPSAIGFCTYYKRQALIDIGLFNSNAFSNGYGEDNDWSLRASSRQWHHMVATDVYVGHKNAATFGNERGVLLQKAAKTMAARWPVYAEMIKKWNEQPLLKSIFTQFDIETIKRTTIKSRSSYITHSLGGGIETYLTNKLKEDQNAVVIRYDPLNYGLFNLTMPNDEYYFLPMWSPKVTDIHVVSDLLKALQVDHIEIESIFGNDYNLAVWMMNLSKLSNIPYDLFLHDYLMVCPRARFNSRVSYCGEPTDPEVCNICVINNGSTFGQVDITDWRNLHNRFVSNARNIYVPSLDTKKHYQRYFPNLDIKCIPHENNIQIGEYQAALNYNKTTDKDLKVAVIGSLVSEKGSNVIVNCANYCLEYNIPIKFYVFGNLFDSNKNAPSPITATANLAISGNYEEQLLPQLLTQNKCHIGFMPSLWPEPYSFTLSHLFRAGLKPLVFDIGAPADRVRDMKFGNVIPLDKQDDIEFILQELFKLAESN